MRFYFVVVNALGRYFRPATPHTGIAYLAAVLMKHGHEVQVLDQRFGHSNEKLFEELDKFKPDVVGLTGPSLEHSIMYDLVKDLKSKNYKVLVGGSHASLIGKKFLEDTAADYCVVGEGEELIEEFAAGKPLADIKGLIWRKDDGTIVDNGPREFVQDLDKIPPPAYELFPLEEYFDKKIPVITSRGCPYRCSFCSIKFTAGRPFRARSAEKVVEEFKKWYDRGYRYFQIPDDNFTMDINRAKKVCDLIVESGMKLEFELRNGMRADRADQELFDKMAAAGCKFVGYGIESIHQDVLDKMKKGLKFAVIPKAIEMAHNSGIKVGAFMIIGLEGDTYDKFTESLNYIIKLKPDEIRFYNAVPYPGTDLYEWVEKNATWVKDPETYLNDSTYWNDQPVFETKDFTKEERAAAYRYAELYVMKNLMQTEFGRLIGYAAWTAWRVKPLRPIITPMGERVWYVMRKTKSLFRPKIHVEDLRASETTDKDVKARDIEEKEIPAQDLEQKKYEQPPKIPA